MNNNNTQTPRPWIVLGILSAIGFMIMYVETMVAPAIPAFIKDFGISYSSVSWILSSYMISAAVSTPILGKLSDTYGRKKILIIGLAMYAIAILASGFSNSIYSMIATRIIQGTGIGIFPVAIGIIRSEFPNRRIAVAQGIITSMFGSGAVVGLAAGGTIIDQLGWRATFFTIIPVSVALVLLVAFYIKDEGREAGAGRAKKIPIDMRGLVAISVAIASLISALGYLGKISDHMISITLFITGFASSVLFVATERKSKFPLIEPSLFFDRSLFASNLMRMSSGIVIFMLFQTIPILVQSPPPSGLGGTASNTAVFIIPMMLAYLLVGLAVGFVLHKIGNINAAIIGGAMGLAGFGFLMMDQSNMVPVMLVMLGAGMQLIHIGGTNLNLSLTPKEHTGISFGLSNVFYLTGCALGPALAAMIMESNLITLHGVAGRFPSQESYSLVFATGFAISIIEVAVSTIMRIRKNSATNYMA